MSENRERRKEGGEHGHGTLQGPTRQAGSKEGRKEERLVLTCPRWPCLRHVAAPVAVAAALQSVRWFTQHAEFDVHLIKSG